MNFNKFAIVFTVLILLTGLSAAFGGGDGSSSNPYEISTCQQLQNMSSDLSAHYNLVSDINCSATSNWNNGNGFKPVGTQSNPFKGSLNGNGHTINELYINRGSKEFVSLIGFSGSSVIVENISLSGVDITGDYKVGGLVADNRGSVTDSFSTGSVSGNFYVGGLVGFNTGSVTDSFSMASVSGSYVIGGLVADNRGSVTDSFSTGSVDGESDVGGLIGRKYIGSATNSYWDNVSSGQSSSAGGIGLTTAEMKGSAAVGNMTGFDFSGTWAAVETSDSFSECDKYPILESLNKSLQIKSQNCAPNASFALEPLNPFVGESISFDASSSTDDAGISSFNWVFGDGSETTGETVSHTYSSSEEYSVQLRVEDAEKVADTVTRNLSVQYALNVNWSSYTSDVPVSGYNVYYGVGSVNESNKKEVGSPKDSTKISSEYWSPEDNVCVEVRPFNKNGEAESAKSCVTIS